VEKRGKARGSEKKKRKIVANFLWHWVKEKKKRVELVFGGKGKKKGRVGSEGGGWGEGREKNEGRKK
jgi:hypothetical protein